MPAMAFDNASICRHFFVGMARSYGIVAINLMAVTHGAPKLALAGIWIAVCQSKLWRSSLGSMHNIKLRQGKKNPQLRGLGDAVGIQRSSMWRRGRDSNPRYAINVHTLSRRAP